MSVVHERRESIFFRAISEIIAHQLTNANISLTTVTSVKLSSDSKHLTIFVVFAKNKDRSLEALKNAGGFIRSQLAKSVETRVVPQLVFKYDDTFEHGHRIDAILKNIKEENKN